MKAATSGQCPCGSGASLAACCGPYHAGLAAPTAEALMRSRYSAYVLQLEPYLLASWHASTRPESLDLSAGAGATKWLGLRVLRHENTDPDHAIVEFVARYRVGGGCAVRLHEVSRFLLEDGRWYYLDGDVRQG
jgi:SEC-C motif-containing protein